jgi:metal-sulfur cluster biosynthetic enzyme
MIDSNAPGADVVWQTLASISDPEFGINIVDLGLIYSVECESGNVSVVMTLTTPTCPSGVWIHEGARSALQQLPGVGAVIVKLVFDPSWNTAMLSDSARRQLGWS